MEQRISVVTLGVKDLARSTAFFEHLGWRRGMEGSEGISFFQCGGIIVGLYPQEDLARDAQVSAEGSGFRSFALAHNVRSKEDVRSVLDQAESAGATIVKPAQDVFWGGYAGYFQDLDGHLWEIAYNPFFPLTDEGSVRLP